MNTISSKDSVERNPKNSISLCSCAKCDTIRCFTEKSRLTHDSISAPTYVYFSNKTVHRVVSQEDFSGSANTKDFENKDIPSTDIKNELTKGKTVSCCATKLDFEPKEPANENEDNRFKACTAGSSKGDIKHNSDFESSISTKPTRECIVCKEKLSKFNFERKTSAPADIMRHSIKKKKCFESNCVNKEKKIATNIKGDHNSATAYSKPVSSRATDITQDNTVNKTDLRSCNLEQNITALDNVMKDSKVKSKQNLCSTVEYKFKLQSADATDSVKESDKSKKDLCHKNKCDYDCKTHAPVNNNVPEDLQKYDFLSTIKQYQCSYKVIPKVNEEIDLIRTYKKESIAKVLTTSNNYFYNALSPEVAELSAQIMNVSLHDSTESVSCHQSHHSADRGTKKLNRYDIINRIIEAYKACSCKYCECTRSSSKPISTKNTCDCKPCACIDCLSMKEEKERTHRLTIDDLTKESCSCEPCSCIECRKIMREKSEYLPPSGCPCIRCDRSDCKGVVSSGFINKVCGCVTDTVSKKCDCAACECLECKYVVFPRTAIVAPVITAPVAMTVQHQSNSCQRTPCDCDECKHTNLPVTTMREVSTEMTNTTNCTCGNCEQICGPIGVDDCPCERPNNAIKKPVKKDTIEYDIRRAMISNNISGNKDVEQSKHEFATAFAVVSNNYLRHQDNNKPCDSGECACLICNCKEGSLSKSSVVKTTRSLSINVSNESVPEY